MVGVTGLEPATSRPPAGRATNCATPRYPTHHTKYSAGTVVLGILSRENAGGCSQISDQNLD